MTIEELILRMISLEEKLKKANFRIYLLEKGKELAVEAKAYGKKKSELQIEQLDLLEAIGN